MEEKKGESRLVYSTDTMLIGAIILILIIILFYVFSMAYKGYKIVFHRRKTFDPFLMSKQSHYYPFKEGLLEEYEKMKHLPQDEYYIVNNRNHQLYARLFKSKEKNRNVILFSHGWHSNGLVDISFIGPWMLDAGFDLLVIDHEGHGNSAGRVTSFGINDLENLKLWINLINKLYNNQCNIILFGVSMGANIVLQAASEGLMNVKMIIEDSGFVSHYTELKAELKRRNPLGIIFFYPFYLLTRIKGLNIKKVDLSKTLKYAKYPILFIHGGQDVVVAKKNVDILYENCKTTKKLYIVEDAGHTYSYQLNKAEYIKQCLDFIDEHNK